MTAPQTVADVLDAAADLIEPEGAWGQGAFARGSQGQPIGPFSPYATCFCLRGALVRVGAINARAENSPATLALGFNSSSRLVSWNDAPGRTQSEVVAALRAAATSARQGETK